ncbi:hypothetical protein HK099_006175 [Clydaea vesicula]|uniref:Uncharacterized protein n=1 Tax=Clydaea vesicula TaxID=447962 RepID=A0AAD5U0L8_9FUNG|nr:hypothetical protein HK099_006175 [Clydaea vesicula]
MKIKICYVQQIAEKVSKRVTGVNSHIFRSDLGNDANNESNINLREKTSDLERINFKNLQKQYFQEKKLNESKIFKIENESKNLENSLLASQNEIKLLKRQSKLLEKTLQTNLAIMDDTKNKNLEEYQKILNLLETERLISKSLRIDLEKSTKLHLIAENNLRDSLNQEKRNNLNLMIELNAYKSNIKSLKEEQIKLQNKEREYLLKSNYCSRENFASRLEICQSQCSPTSESAERYNKEKFLELKKENLNLKNKFEIMQKSYEKVTSNTFNANCEIRGGNIPRQNLTAPLESEDFLLVPGSFKSNKPGIVSRIKSKKELSRKTPYLKSTPLPLKTFFTNTERKFKRS